jgi:4-hydroxy-2-oxoheptanedioate aldolase
MLKPNALKARLRAGDPAFGLIASIPTPVAVEMIGEAGFDFVIIDTEHVAINPETIENMIRAAETVGVTPLVRVSSADPKEILRVLDGGAMGIVMPAVESVVQMRVLVEACRYFPAGNRSLGSGRAGAFGRDSLADYVVHANDEILVVPMIETRQGVEHIAEMLAVPGIDMVLEGAADLSQSLGRPWGIDVPEVQDALRRVQRACGEAGIPYCAIARAPGDVALWQGRGVRQFVLGDERGIAFRALQSRLHSISTGEDA